MGVTHVPKVAATAESDFLFDRMESRLNRERGPLGNVEVVTLWTKLKGRLDPMILGRGGRSLQAAGDGSPVGPHFVQVNRGGDDLDVLETELGALGDCIAVRALLQNTDAWFTHRCHRSLKGIISMDSNVRSDRIPNQPMIMAQPSKYRRSPLRLLADHHLRTPYARHTRNLADSHTVAARSAH